MQSSPPSEWQTAELPERGHAESELRNAQADLQKTREGRRIARAAVEERGSAIDELRVEVLRVQSSVEFRTESFKRRQEKLQSDAEAAPDDQLAAAMNAAAQAVCEQQELVSKREAEWSVGTRPQLEARIGPTGESYQAAGEFHEQT